MVAVRRDCMKSIAMHHAVFQGAALGYVAITAILLALHRAPRAWPLPQTIALYLPALGCVLGVALRGGCRSSVRAVGCSPAGSLLLAVHYALLFLLDVNRLDANASGANGLARRSVLGADIAASPGKSAGTWNLTPAAYGQVCRGASHQRCCSPGSARKRLVPDMAAGEVRRHVPRSRCIAAGHRHWRLDCVHQSHQRRRSRVAALLAVAESARCECAPYVLPHWRCGGRHSIRHSATDCGRRMSVRPWLSSQASCSCGSTQR